MKQTRKQQKEKQIFLKEFSKEISNLIDDSYDAGVERAFDEVLKVIDAAQTYKMHQGQEDIYIDKRVIREAVLALKRGEEAALKGGEQE